ncbi:MAG: TIGR02757 family protein [Pseudomonadota bacterium]
MIDKKRLEILYDQYNHTKFIYPDPVAFLHQAWDDSDREIVAFIASSLAYGNVSQILKSIASVLKEMAPSPAQFLRRSSKELLISTFSGFKHRFTTGRELALILFGIKCIVEQYGDLQACLVRHIDEDGEPTLSVLSVFSERILSASGVAQSTLVPIPSKGSACKRLNLFMRWMVRQDNIDPGGWDCISASKLIVPLDIHMHRICHALGFTRRKQADMRTALEITNAFRSVVPEDPVRYDFALTRLGIREDGDLEGFLREYDCKD